MEWILFVLQEEPVVCLNLFLDGPGAQVVVHLAVVVTVAAGQAALVGVAQVAAVQMDVDLVESGQICVVIVSRPSPVIADCLWVGVAGQLKQLHPSTVHCPTSYQE